MQNKEGTLKAAREQDQMIYKSRHVIFIPDFSVETLKSEGSEQIRCPTDAKPDYYTRLNFQLL